jgi:hypothetical protein
MHWITANALYIGIAWFVFSNAVGFLPPPDISSGKGYKFLYQMAHFISANLARVVATTRLASVLPGFGSTLPTQIMQANAADAKAAALRELDSGAPLPPRTPRA